MGLISRLINGDQLPKGIADRDLWEKIAFMIQGQEKNYKVRWMPSHLEGEQNAEKKRQSEIAGIMDEHDIYANDQADELA